MLRAQMRRHLPLEAAFIKRTVCESDGECFQTLANVVVKQCRDGGRVQPAAEVSTHRHIGAQAQSGSFGKEVTQLNGRFRQRHATLYFLCRKRGLPILLDGYLPITHQHEMARRQGLYALENGTRRQWTPVSKNLVQRGQIQLGYRWLRCQNRLHFRGEDELIILRGIEKRPYSHAVPSNKQRMLQFVPNGKGKLAVQPAQASRAIRLVQVQNHFCVAVRGKIVTQLNQLFAQFAIVEDFAVKANPQRAIFIAQRLLPTSQVDDAEPGMPQPHAANFVLEEVKARLVRAAMLEQPHHLL